MSRSMEERPDNSWRSHLRGTLALGLPLAGAQLLHTAINTTDVILVGWLGPAELAAVVLATQIFYIVFLFGVGFTNASIPLIAQARSSHSGDGVRRALRMGLWVALGYGLLAAPLLWFSQPLLLALGQPGDVAARAESYLRVALWGMFPGLALFGLRSFITALERGKVVLYVMGGMFVINGVVAYVLIFGHFGAPALGLHGAAVAAVCANLSGFLIALAYVGSNPQMRAYGIFGDFLRPDWHVAREIVGLGLPMSMTVLAETGLFAAASLLMGRIGTLELAAHGIALQVASIAFMIPLGLSQAATVRIGLANGRGDIVALKRAAVAAMAVAIVFAAAASLLFMTMPDVLGALFLDARRADSQAVLALAVPLIMIAGLFQFFDGAQVTVAGLLRGLKDARVPMILALIAYWPIGFAGAYVFAFVFGLGARGVWYGIVLGLATAALLLGHRFWSLQRRLS